MSNIDSPYSPYELATFPLSDPATQVANGVDVDEARQLAYLAVRNGGLLVIDVSNPSAPHLRGAVETGPVNLDVAAMGSTTLIAADRSFFLKTDCFPSIPKTPMLHKSLGSPHSTTRF